MIPNSNIKTDETYNMGANDGMNMPLSNSNPFAASILDQSFPVGALR